MAITPYLKKGKGTEALPAPSMPAASVAPVASATPAITRRQPSVLQSDGLEGARAIGGDIKTGVSMVKRGLGAFDTGMDNLTKQPQAMNWDMYATRDRSGFPAVAYADTAGGEPQLHPMPSNFFRPRTGPQSASNADGTQVGAAPAIKWNMGAAPAPAPTAVASGAGGAATPNGADFSHVQGSSITQRQVTPDNGGGAPATSTPPGIDSGTTGVQGQHLNYGANVNGVATYSDGSGGMARTMSPESIKQLGQERSISRADTGALGTPLASDSLGYTPSTGQMVAQRMAQIQQPITGSRPSAQQFADADRIAIASGDPRSAAGTAARNLRMDAQYGTSGVARNMAAEQLAQLTAGTQQSAITGQQADAQQANTALQGNNTLKQIAAQGQNSLAKADLTGQYGLQEAKQRAQIRRPGSQVTLADGTLGVQDGATGAITQSMLPDGSIAHALPKNTAPIYTSAGGAQMLMTMTNQFLGVNPLSGMIDDKNAPDGHRMPTADEVVMAQRQARDSLKQLNNNQGAGGPTPTIDKFLDAAKAANPGVSESDLRTYYNKTYGTSR